jgi:hypothetical protein
MKTTHKSVTGKTNNQSKLVLVIKVVGLLFGWSIVAGILSSIISDALNIPKFPYIFFSPDSTLHLQILVSIHVLTFIILPALLSLKWKLFRFVAILNIFWLVLMGLRSLL